MKLATKILSLLVMIGLATFYMGCDKGGGDDKTEEEIQFGKLKSTWALSTATEDGVQRDDFTDLVLTLSGTFSQGNTYQYSFTGTRPSPSPWPVAGTWKFGTNASTDIIRDPGPGSPNELPMTYSVSDTQLTISFNVPEGHTGWVGGTSRAKSVTGDWVFVFTKQ